jgi:hypothetical protein
MGGRDRHQHADQRGGDDDVGDEAGHAQAAAHGVGADEDAGDEDRGGHHA